MNLRRIEILLEKELRDFYSSKAWIITLILPLFITFLFATVYRENPSYQFKIGVVGRMDPVLKRIITGPNIKSVQYQNLSSAKRSLSDKRIDGILITDSKLYRNFSLLTANTEAPKAAVVVNTLNTALVQIYSREKLPQIKLVVTETARKASSLALPLWLIQIILTSCLLQNAAAIAEEKAKHTLHSLLVSPMTLTDYFITKIIWNSVVGVLSILATLMLTRFPFNPVYLLIFSLLGCIVYSCAALLIGLLAPNALFARTTSTAFYLLSAVPLMLKNSSIGWKDLLNFFPTFPILHGLEQAVLQSPFHLNSMGFMFILIVESFILLSLIYFKFQDNIEF